MLIYLGFPGGSVVKNLPANARDTGSISGSGRFLGEGHGSPLQYSSLRSPTDRGAWWATVHRIVKIRTRLSDWAHMLTYVATDRKLQHFIIYTFWEHYLSPIPNLMVAQIYRFPEQGHTHGQGPSSQWWEALEVFMFREEWTGVTQWSFCAGFSLCLMYSANQDRGSLFHTDLNHMQILCISLYGPLKTSLSWALGFPVLLWFSFKNSE